MARQFGATPRVALISHSTFGNPKMERSEKIREAVSILDRREDIDFEYEGEMNADVALNPDMRELYPFSRLSEPANVLVMPALHSASIATRLLQTVGGATVIGPVLTGLVRADPDRAAWRHGVGHRHLRDAGRVSRPARPKRRATKRARALARLRLRSRCCLRGDDKREHERGDADQARIEEEDHIARAERRGGHAELRGARERSRRQVGEQSAQRPRARPPSAARAEPSTMRPDCAAISFPGSA